MGKEEIIKRIQEDAASEAAEILSAARAQAESILAEAEKQTQAERAEAEAEVKERATRISEGKAAAARLDSAKILLAEKRRVLEAVYRFALNELIALSERESVALCERLLAENAEEGDEVVFAENFKYAEKVKLLPVAKERKLAFAKERADISGGILLRGKTSDKDLSFAALLHADMEEHQAEIAAVLFKANK